MLAGIIGLGLTLRLVALKVAQTTEPDALARVMISWEWLFRPNTGIEGGVWLPLHTYLLGSAFHLHAEPYFLPILINIICSVLTAVPLYWFCKKEFEPSGFAGAAIVATAFMLFPLAFRNSLMALSDTPFALLLATSLLPLARARDDDGTIGHTVLAGLLVTLSAGVRYEGWVLIPFLALVLWRRPGRFVIFGAVAMIVPCLWMAGCWAEHGHPLYSLRFQAADTAAVLSDRGGISTLKRIVRTVFFPGVLCIGLSPLVFGLSVWGAVLEVSRRSRNAIWLVPFLGLFLVLAYKSVSGTMNLQPRYAIPIGMLLMPYMITALAQIPSRRTLVTIAALALMLPSSYALHLLRPLTSRLLADTEMIKKEPPEYLLEAVPRLVEDTSQRSQQLKQWIQADDGFVLLGVGELAYLYVQEIRHPLPQVCLVAHYHFGKLRYEQHCYRRFEQFPKGVLLVDLAHWPEFVSRTTDGTAMLANGKLLELTELDRDESEVVYRYQCRDGDGS